MKKSSFAVTMHIAAILSGVLTVLFALLCHFGSRSVYLSPAITFGTTFYHFAMRLLVGALVPNRFDYEKRWFRVSTLETALYRRLGLKRWKGQLPTYNPRLFSLEENTPEQIVCNMCQAEIVHEVIIALSFVPLLFSSVWDSFWVFLITSVLAAGFDFLFVMLQRFNRPRMIKFMHLQARRNSR